MATTEFGFYPVRYDTKFLSFEIVTLDEFDEHVRLVKSDPGVERGWIYPPLMEQVSFGVPGRRVLPYVNRVFGLPKTHRLIHTLDNPKRLSFLVWVFGFFVGMRMSDQERGFLDAAALHPGMSNDVVWCDDSLQIALTQTDAFFEKHDECPEVERAIRAVVHSYFLADLPTLLDFERSLHLYTAVDAAYAAHGHIHGGPAKRVFHSERIAYLCERLSIPIPWWAERNSPFIAERRNEAIHEGLFFGEPWGFATFGGMGKVHPKERMVLLELQKLMSRFIFALLEVRDETYLQSSVGDRQRHGIHLL